MLENFWRLIAYLRYVLFAKHAKGHGIHSPFVYALIRNVFLDKQTRDDFALIENYRKSLCESKKVIEYSDLGAGSKKMGREKRKIREIARIASVTRKYGRLLYRLINYLNARDILELGTSLGISTHYMSLANPNARVVSIESNYNLLDIVMKQLKQLGIHNVKLLEGEFDKVLPTYLSEIEQLDFVFLDGNHTKEATLRYYQLIKPRLHNNSCVVLDDIYWSQDMHAAWNEIKSDSFVRVSIDIFQFGILFFRKESSKEDFIIKY